MLELIFQGLIEWIYGLVLEAWEYFVVVFMDILNLDFTYLEDHMDVLPVIRHTILAIGWALLIGNLVFQATKSMMTGLGFEGEDPKLLFTRSFVFAFLLVASPQICDIGLELTSRIITLLEIPDAVDVTLVGDDAFGASDAAWLLVIIVNIVLMFKVFRMLLEIVEQYLVLAFLTICAPMAFGMGGSRNTSDIFTGWCRMFGSMCFVIMSNMLFFKLLLSLLSSVPTGTDILLWIALVFGLVRVARKVDAIITRIGLNPAITGDGLGGRTLPGMLAYTVFRSMASNIIKAAGKSAGSSARGSSSGGSSSKNANGGKPKFSGSTGGAAGGTTSSGKSGTDKNHTSSQSRSSDSTKSGTQQNTATNTASQSNTQSSGGSSWNPAGSPVPVSPDDKEAAAMEGSMPGTGNVNPQAQPTGAKEKSTDRKTSVPPGATRGPSHVNGKTTTGQKTGSSSVKNSTASTSTNSSRNTSARPSQSQFGATAASPSASKPPEVKGGESIRPGRTGTDGTLGGQTKTGSLKSPQPGLVGNSTRSGVHVDTGKPATSRSDPAGTGEQSRPATGNGKLPHPGMAGKDADRGKRAEGGSMTQPNTAGAPAAAQVQRATGKATVPQPGLAEKGKPIRTFSGKNGKLQTGTAGTASGGSDTRKTSVKPTMSQLNTAPDGLGTAPKGTMPQPGLADMGTVRPGSERSGMAAFGAAGTAEGGESRKLSAKAPAVRPGMAGIGGTKPAEASQKGNGTRPGSAGSGMNPVPAGASGENGTAPIGKAGTAGGVSEHTAHIGVQAAQNAAAGPGAQQATRYSNAQRVSQNQTVQNAVNTGQQNAVTLEGAKQVPAAGAGKVPPTAAPGANASGSGKDNRFTQRPATVHAPIGGEKSPAGTAGTAWETQVTPEAREATRMGGAGTGITPPAAVSAPGTAQQETRVTHQTAAAVPGTQRPGEPSASRPKAADSGKRGAPSTASTPQKPHASRSISGEAGKRITQASGSVRQESRPPTRSTAAAGAAPSGKHPGIAGIAPPAARVSHANQGETRPPRPEEPAAEETAATVNTESAMEQTEVTDDGE